MMDQRTLLAHIQVLGRAFVRLGLRDHATKLRLYYLATKNKLTGGKDHDVDVHWSASFVVEWMQILRLPPHANDLERRAPGAGCPKCEKATAGVQTIRTFPGGSYARCQTCGTKWLELEEERIRRPRMKE